MRERPMLDQLNIVVHDMDAMTGLYQRLGVTFPSSPPEWSAWTPHAAAGYACEQPPYDAFWGSRFAVVTDPDGTSVGLMSPRDPDMGSAPPEPLAG